MFPTHILFTLNLSNNLGKLAVNTREFDFCFPSRKFAKLAKMIYALNPI